MTPHPQRCDIENQCQHFCVYKQMVCSVYIRCASHSNATEQQKPDLSHITPERRGCLTCLAPDCPIWQAADQNCWKLQPYTPTSDRDKVLNILTELREFHADNWYPIGLQERTAWYKKIDKMIASLNIHTTPAPEARR